MHYPKVSLHVAICSEPPDVVVETLDALSRLDYPNFGAVMNGVASQVLGWCVQRRAMRCSFVDVLCASFARHALAYSTASASLRALVGLPMTWQRTNKFKTQLEGVRRTIRSARVELMLALALIAAGAAGLVQQPRGLLLLLFIWLSLQGVGYLATPILALIGEWELARGADREAAADRLVEQADAIAEAAFQVAPLVVGDSLALGTRP